MSLRPLFYKALIAVVLVSACSPMEEDKTLFLQLDAGHTGITFSNDLVQTPEVNVYTFRNFFNGSGVGIGDFNNDGFKDIYYAGNQVDNQLYINKGNLQFEDITSYAGVACKNIWSTGISIADVNGDGWDDIYVCKSGKPDGPNRHNELFINNGDVDAKGRMTFTERSEEYGIDDEGLSIHAAFFDYDRDGDLDCYLLNNSLKTVSTLEPSADQREIRDTLGGNKLYRNDGGVFIDVSTDAGIYGSAIGFGLGVTVTDVDRDGWPDFYVSNDFYERDYLYLNLQNGSFRECLTEYMPEISRGSMGAAAGDLNNDGYPDFFVTDMLPSSNERMKSKTHFENWKKYKENRDKGYHRQFTRNTLQISNGDGTYSEISRKAGVAATDWSWGALIFDMNLDGFQDIFVANGLLQDLTDQDYINFQANTEVVREIIRTEEDAVLKIIEKMPSVALSNCVFINQGHSGDPTFEDEAMKLGLGSPGWSNGSAYADLDNDGDLELIINNINGKSSIYKNHAVENGKAFLKIKTKKSKSTSVSVIGVSVVVHVGKDKYTRENHTMQGYQSTVDSDIIIGFNDAKSIDSLFVHWPSGRIKTYYNLGVNQTVEIYEEDAVVSEARTKRLREVPKAKTVFSIIDSIPGFSYLHQSFEINDFDKEGLMMQMITGAGPNGIATDYNGDGLEDLIITNGRGGGTEVYVQKNNGFQNSMNKVFRTLRSSEHTAMTMADFNGDGRKDYYLVGGGTSYSLQDVSLQDALLLSASDDFKLSTQTLPTFQYQSGSVVVSGDWDQDGDEDLFVGSRYVPNYYGVDPPHYILDNGGEGHFADVSNTSPNLVGLGMITAAVSGDIDNDGDKDIVVVGDWTRIIVLENRKGIFTIRKDHTLENTFGFWHTVLLVDMDNDGYLDIVAGNDGTNSLLSASKEKPIELWLNDYDQNGKTDPVVTAYNGDLSYPIHLRQDIIKQLPFLQKDYPSYASFVTAQIGDLFPPELLKGGIKKKVTELRSMALLNKQQDGFELKPLPDLVQRSSVYAILANDVNEDGIMDLLLGGNTERIKPELGGYNAGYGNLLLGKGDGTFTSISPSLSGISIQGEIRDILEFSFQQESYILVLRNDTSPVIIKKN